VVNEDGSCNDVSSSSELITSTLVTFKDIAELQEQNQKLLAVSVREYVARHTMNTPCRSITGFLFANKVTSVPAIVNTACSNVNLVVVCLQTVLIKRCLTM